ncbi:MAG: transposase [Deltaproteobacteria bacterium]|nr:transposase [Deltaproteobacteria bacterium]
MKSQGSKRRKAKVSKAQTYSGRRRADRARRARRRARTEQRQQAQRQFKFRVKVVRTYHKLQQQVCKKRAIELTLARFGPTEPGHFPLCESSIRQWDRIAKKEGFAALRPKSKRPHTIQFQVPERVVGVIFTLRRLFGWGGHRIAAELKARQMGKVSAKTVYTVFERLGLPVKVYALKGRSDGIFYRPYEKHRPNAQWHIDLKHTTLSDGSKVYICIIVDDYSRCALAAVALRAATTHWVTQVAKQAILRCGCPDQLVSDNGREFVCVWEDTLTKFGQLLAENGIEHLRCAPYYPQGNGKAEAFIKTLTREVLTGRTFDCLDQLQKALDRYLTYYNNYRLHSALGWKPPISRYAGRSVTIRGLAGIPGIEPMAADSGWGVSHCDLPIEITPVTARNAGALTVVGYSSAVAAA